MNRFSAHITFTGNRTLQSRSFHLRDQTWIPGHLIELSFQGVPLLLGLHGGLTGVDEDVCDVSSGWSWTLFDGECHLDSGNAGEVYKDRRIPQTSVVITKMLPAGRPTFRAGTHPQFSEDEEWMEMERAWQSLSKGASSEVVVRSAKGCTGKLGNTRLPRQHIPGARGP